MMCKKCGSDVVEGDICDACRQRIKFKSLHEVDDGLFGLKFMEGGGYISDWLHKLPAYTFSRCVVSDKVAHMILKDVGLEPSRYGNKDFFRFTTDEEKFGFNESVVISFLYRHDFTWYIYTLNT